MKTLSAAAMDAQAIAAPFPVPDGCPASVLAGGLCSLLTLPVEPR